jgi:triosephosphate isomerase
MRKKIIAGNWKMNTTKDEAIALLNSLTENIQENILSENKIVVVATPFPYLHFAASAFTSKKYFYTAAQNCSEYEQGAYTGEVSAKMLASLEVQYVIIGHSERRQYFNENDEILLQKLLQVHKQHLTPIFCCGEPLDIRLSNKHYEFVQQQLDACLFQLEESYLKKCVIAYEPIWAIGTGKTATPEQAQEMHAFIRNEISNKYSPATAEEISILYGGSVNAKNAVELFSCKDIDGGLVGGASLNAVEFKTIIQSMNT